jgi:SP family myo-inositol transporter-like MFS transporter 13
MGIAWSYNSLVLGRIIVGGGIGLASLTTPMYIAEVASPSTRGTLVTVNGLLICFGQFSAGMIDGILDEIDPDNGWRIMLGLAAVPSISIHARESKVVGNERQESRGQNCFDEHSRH